MFGSIEIRWLGRASRPIVANTAVSASRSGMPAATTAPNTSTRIKSVSGIDRSPALASCELKSLSSALPVEIEPASET